MATKQEEASKRTRRFIAKLERARAEYQYDKVCGEVKIFSHYVKDFKIGVGVKDILEPYFNDEINTEECYRKIVAYWRMKELKKRNRAQIKASCTEALEHLQQIYNANHDDWKELLGVEVKLEVIQPEAPVEGTTTDKDIQPIIDDLFANIDNE